jgi:hypothetical protein
LTQYDFEVGATSQSTQLNVPKCKFCCFKIFLIIFLVDSTFIPSSTNVENKNSSKSRKFFVAKMPPPGWHPSTNRTKSLLHSGKKDVSKKLPESVVKVSTQLTPFQRAKLLGERDHSVMEMLSNEQRAKLKMNNFVATDNSQNENVCF